MAELRWNDHSLYLGQTLHTDTVMTVLTPDGGACPVPIRRADLGDGAACLEGAAGAFAAVARWAPRAGRHARYYDVALTVTYLGEAPAEAAIQVRYGLAGAGRPTWLIPGAFYKENRLAHCQRIYPRYDYAGGDPGALVSDTWAFRADRAAVPAVFGWTERGCGALATGEMSPLGLTGMGFAGNADGTAIWLNFPYREEPVTFTAPGEAGAPDRPFHRWQPGEQAVLHYRVYVSGGTDFHACDPFVRELYALDQAAHPLNPWMGLAEAAELTAHGLYRWHYKPGDSLLCETAVFDRELAGQQGLGDRPNMHVAWVSGAPYAAALLTYGRSHAQPEYVEAGARVLDKIASGLAPCGTFWGEWRADRGWSQGWTPNRKWLQARTLSEATLFMLRALRAEAELGVEHPTWRDAVLSNLRFAAGAQRDDGSFGAYYHVDTGEVVEWEGAAGILWIAALLEGAATFGEERFRAAALHAGVYYARFVTDGFIYGAPEDVHLTPTSEDGYNATIAYVLLYEADPQAHWLELARLAADWTMTFRWTYNLTFDRHTMLRQFDFRSRGADLASPSNQHLHNYGLICLPEMLRLWRHTGDPYYRDRTRDNLACFLQFIARADGDFNAYRGMVTERYYNTNCFQPKGMLLTLSHAWSAGMILYAAQAAVGFAADLEGIAP